MKMKMKMKMNAPGGEQPAVLLLTATHANIIAHLNEHFSPFFFAAEKGAESLLSM